jgi:hypothetical protein
VTQALGRVASGDGPQLPIGQTQISTPERQIAVISISCQRRSEALEGVHSSRAVVPGNLALVLASGSPPQCQTVDSGCNLRSDLPFILDALSDLRDCYSRFASPVALRRAIDNNCRAMKSSPRLPGSHLQREILD